MDVSHPAIVRLSATTVIEPILLNIPRTGSHVLFAAPWMYTVIIKIKNVKDGVKGNSIIPCVFVNYNDKKCGGLFIMIKDKEYYKKKAEKIAKYIDLISKRLKNEKTEKQQIIEGLEDAYKDWQQKEEYFKWVTDPDLIDYSIYAIKASKIKYSYFLKKAKEMGNK